MEFLSAFNDLANSNIVIVAGILATMILLPKAYGNLIAPFAWIPNVFLGITMPLLFTFGRQYRSVFDFVSTIPFVSKHDISAHRLSDYVMAKADEIKFDAREVAEKYWPSDKYPELYQVIRPGLEVTHIYNGKLLGGYDKSLLINNIYSKDLHANALRSGLDTAAAVALGFFLVVSASEVLSLIPTSSADDIVSELKSPIPLQKNDLTDIGEHNRAKDRESVLGNIDHPTIIQKMGCFFHIISDSVCQTIDEKEKLMAARESAYEEMGKRIAEKDSSKSNVDPADVLETWGSYQLEREVSFFEHIGNAKDYVLSATSALFFLALDFVLIAIASVAIFFLAATMLVPAIVVSSINGSSGKWWIPTKDMLNRWRLLLGDVLNWLENYREALGIDRYVAETYGDDLIDLGCVTGSFGVRGVVGAPPKGARAALDMESVFSNICCFGATGIGKSTAICKRLFKELAVITNRSGNRFGALCLDAKGVLWRDLQRSANRIGRGDDVVLVGFDEGMLGIDPLANLKPADVASAIRSVMSMSGGEGKDPYWHNTAEILINNVTSLVYALSRKKYSDETSEASYYSLKNIYYLMSDDNAQAAALKVFADKPPVQSFFIDGYDQLGQLKAALIWLNGEWANLAPTTKSGVLSNAAAVFNPIFSNPTLANKFSAENENAERIENVFNGKLFMLSISAVEHNTAATLMLVLIKSSFYRAAAVREIQIGKDECHKKPAFVMIDEAQAIVSGGQLGEGEVLNRNRSSGFGVILVSQGLSAYYMKLGKEAATNMLEQCRTKMIMQLEDLQTWEFFIQFCGKARRALSYSIDIAESVEYLQSVMGHDFTDYDKETEDAANHAKSLVDNAKIFRAGDQVKKSLSLGEINSLFVPDQRFLPTLPAAHDRRIEAANLETSYAKETTHRAEDKYREFLAEGNDYVDVLTSSDFTSWGRFKMLVVYQRAGILRMDIVETEHDYT